MWFTRSREKTRQSDGLRFGGTWNKSGETRKWLKRERKERKYGIYGIE